MHRDSLRTLLMLALVSPLAACNEGDPTQPAMQAEDPAIASAIGSWTARKPMPTPRYDHVAGAARNAAGAEVLYVFSGTDPDETEGGQHASLDIYDPSTDSWTSRPAPFSETRFNGIGRIDGKFYLPGGGGETGNGFEIDGRLLIYDPVLNAWSVGASMPQESSDGVAGVIGGKLYVLTGLDNLVDGCPDCGRPIKTRQLYRYNPVTDKWVARKQAPRFHVAGAAGVIDGKFYVVGGLDEGPSGTVESRRLDIYDPATNRWSTGAPMPVAASDLEGAVLGRKLYVLHGASGKVFAYDPAKNRWTTKASLPTPRPRLAAAKLMVGGRARIVAVGGLAEPFQQHEMYTP